MNTSFNNAAMRDIVPQQMVLYSKAKRKHKQDQEDAKTTKWHFLGNGVHSSLAFQLFNDVVQKMNMQNCDTAVHAMLVGSHCQLSVELWQGPGKNK